MPTTDCKTFANPTYSDGIKTWTCSVCEVGKILIYQTSPPVIKEVIHNPAGHA